MKLDSQKSKNPPTTPNRTLLWLISTIARGTTRRNRATEAQLRNTLTREAMANAMGEQIDPLWIQLGIMHILDPQRETWREPKAEQKQFDPIDEDFPPVEPTPSTWKPDREPMSSEERRQLLAELDAKTVELKWAFWSFIGLSISLPLLLLFLAMVIAA